MPKCWVIHAENRQETPCLVRRSKTTLPAHESAYPARQPIPLTCTGVDNSSFSIRTPRTIPQTRQNGTPPEPPNAIPQGGQGTSPATAPSTQPDDRDAHGLRKNGLLRAILEQDTRDFSERPSVTIPGIGTISYGEYYNRCSNIDYFNLRSEKGLLAAAQNVIPMLLQYGLIRQEDIKTKDDILLITKEYLRMEITRNRILKCREDGDFMIERGAFAENYIPFPPSQNDFSVPASQPQSIEPRYPVKGEWINTESHTFRVIPQNRRVTLDRKRLAEELNTLLGEQNAQTLMAKCEKQGEPFERLYAVEV